MRVIKEHYFNHKRHSNGQEILEKANVDRLAEVLGAINKADLEKCREPGKPGKPAKPLYSPQRIAGEILGPLHSTGWSRPKIMFGKPDNFIEGDGLKNGVGVEIQFGNYAFLGWDSLRKMSLFGRSGVYRYGIEIVPMASLRRKMSKGVGSFEQVTERLEKTGNPELSIPVVVLGIDG
jgi:hypothetical protein